MKIESITDYYRHLNDNTTCHKIEIGTTPILKGLYDQESDDRIKRNLYIEILVCDFEFNEGKNQAVYSTTYEDGTVYEYPSYFGFTEDDYAYLQERATTVTNDYLIARYNQILWNSPREHNQKKFINISNAINAYYRIVSAYKQGDDKDEFDYFEIYKNAFALALSVQHKIHEFKTIYRKWIFESDAFEDKMKVILIRHLANLPHLKKADFNKMPELLLKYGMQELKDGSDAHWASEIFKVGLRIAQRTGEETNSWNEYIGDSFVSMADNRKNDDSGMVKMEWYRNAVLYYRAAGAKEKMNTTEVTLDNTRSNLKLSTVSLPCTEEQIQLLKNVADTIANEILEKTPDEIYEHLMFDPRIFPTKQYIYNLPEDKNNYFTKFAYGIKFDNNNNIASTGDESDKECLLGSYDFRIRYNLPIIHRIFYGGFKSGKVSYETLIEYFKKNSWYTQTLTTNDSAGNAVNYNWISVIAPALHNFFWQLGFEINNPEFPSSYVLPIDSLAIKLEGVLREISKLCKVPTMTVGRDGSMRLKNIEDLLSEDGIVKFLGENNIVFLQYFFTKRGQNIRNDVAHAFYRFNNYSPMIMMLLICTFLKLGRFKLVSVPIDEAERYHHDNLLK